MSSIHLAAVIFDVDGTLAETERDGHRLAFNLAFREHGLDWHWDADLYGELLYVTGGKERLAAYMHLFQSCPVDSSAARALILNLHRTKTRHFRRIVEQGRLTARPWVIEILTELHKAGIRLAIATTTSPENVAVLIESILGSDVCAWFEFIGAGDAVTAKKPDPAIYDWVLDRLGLSPYSCLAVEDSRNGMLAAHAAGLPVIITRSFYSSFEDFPGATAVIHNFDGTRNLDENEVRVAEPVNLNQLRHWHRLVGNNVHRMSHLPSFRILPDLGFW
jgi:beta-phosphoglucomutase-like phosphatase (HAD superfamily)